MKWLLWIVLLSLPVAVQAQTATSNTTPSGFFTLNIAAGTGTTSVLSLLSVPLLNDANVTGPVRGVISAVSTSTFTNSSDGSQNNPGWTAGQLSSASAPLLIRITSGQAIGRTFLISSSTPNTATTLTIQDATDLTTLGIAAGTDTYEILAGYTLATLFPASVGMQSGGSPTNVDIVQLFVAGAWNQYYYDGSHWRRAGPNTVSDNVVIRPDTGIIYSRIGNTALSVVLMGSVPVVNAASMVANSGITFVGNTWPVNLTLATSSINQISGWVSSASPSTSDIVQFLVSGAWNQYYYDGSHWRRAGPNTVSDNVAIPAGTSIILSKQGSTTGTTPLSQSVPYAASL